MRNMFELATFIESLVPTSFEALVWWGIGGGLARSFGKQLDQDIQEGAWFAEQSPWVQNLVKRLLNFLHHWWGGALIMLYGPTYLPQWPVQVYWFGAGIFVDDLPDLYVRVKEMKAVIAETLSVEPQECITPEIE